MTLKELKEHLSNYYKFDISERTRQREYCYARKVYCRIAREIGYTLQQIGNEVGLSHDAVLYHYRGFNVVSQRDKRIFNQIIKDYSLPIQLCALPKQRKPKANIKPVLVKTNSPQTYKEELINNIIDAVNEWETETLNHFVTTRLKPFEKLRESTKPQIQPQKIKGAKLKRPVKNPVLC